MPLVIPADTMAGVMGTEPPPAAWHGALRGTGQRQGWRLFSVLGQTWLLRGPSELQAEPILVPCAGLQRPPDGTGDGDGEGGGDGDGGVHGHRMRVETRTGWRWGDGNGDGDGCEDGNGDRVEKN